MTHDEHLVPARSSRELGTTLADLTQTKGYGKYPRYGTTAPETNLKEYLFVVLKRKWLIMSLMLVITSLATIQAYRDPSIYEGATKLRIEPKPQSVLSTGNLVIAGQTDPNFWGTQLQLLQNPQLARQVILTLDLQHDPKFLNGQAQTTIFASLKRIFSRDKQVQSVPATAPNIEPVGEEELRSRQFTPEELTALEPYEDAIAAGETIETIDRTNLVMIHFRHTDPVLAQKIANTLADVFVSNNIERVTAGASKAEVTLTSQIAKVQEKIKKEEQDRFAFAKAHNLPIDNTPGSNLE